MVVRTLTFLVFAVLLITSCSSMSLKVESNPEKAKVYLKDDNKLIPLGETPLDLNPNQLGSHSQINIVVKKDGYQESQFLIEKRTLSAKAEIYAHLETSGGAMARDVASVSTTSDSQQRSLATIQSQLLQKKYREAEQSAQSFVDENPFSAVGWNLLGNSYMLQNRHSEARKAYSKALEFDPNNIETQKMIEYLEFRPSRRER